nr:zinc finger, CCHC-type, retrotransposon Gag domain protein [Tanacetum cinerariifolium]
MVSLDIVSCIMVSFYILRHCELHNGLVYTLDIVSCTMVSFYILRHCGLHNGLISFTDIKPSKFFCLHRMVYESKYCMRAGIRISGIEMVIGFRTGDRVNRRLGVVMTRVSMCIGVVRTRVLSIGVVRIEVMNRNDRIFRVRIRGLLGHASGSSGQRRSTETLPPPPLYATYGKPHPGVCYKATGGCFTCGSTQHKVKDCPQRKKKQSMSMDHARLPPTTRQVYATTRGQAAKTS